MCTEELRREYERVSVLDLLETEVVLELLKSFSTSE